MTLGDEKLDVFRLSIDDVAMLSRLGRRVYPVKENLKSYGRAQFDPDFDSDFNPDENKSQQINTAAPKRHAAD